MVAGDDSAQIELRLEGRVAIITIANKKRRNAFTFEMLKEIPKAFDAVERNPYVGAVVLEGAGDIAFASGDDISEFDRYRSTPADEAVFMATALAAFSSPIKCAKPVVAAVSGFCMGGGMQLAAACDARICGRNAKFAVPASRLGVGYPVDGIARFVHLIGAAHTSKIFISGRTFSCEEMKAVGFVTEMVEDQHAKSTAYRYAAELAELAPLSLHALKVSIAACAGGGEEKRRKALELIAQCARSADFIEGRNAFLQKRKPLFNGT